MPSTATIANPTRSSANGLLRQNGIRGLIAAVAFLALLLWPAGRADVVLFRLLATLTGYVAAVGVTSVLVWRQQRVATALLSIQSALDVLFLALLAWGLAELGVPSSWMLVAAAVPFLVTLNQAGTRAAVLVAIATVLSALAAAGASAGESEHGVATTVAVAGYALLAVVSLHLHRSDQRRLATLAALFREARDGNLPRPFEEQTGSRADAITAVGAAFNGLRAELAPLVHADPATGCLNRRGFAIELERALVAARTRRGEVALLAVDLDHFKQINDRFGHLVGDEVLYHVAAVLVDAVGDDGVVARMGGEEFTVLLPDADSEHAGAMAERLAARLRDRPCIALPNESPVTMSVGISVERVTDLEVGSALRARADEALYAAKRTGRNRVLLWAPGVRSNATPPTSMAAIGGRRSGDIQRPRYRTPPESWPTSSA